MFTELTSVLDDKRSILTCFRQLTDFSVTGSEQADGHPRRRQSYRHKDGGGAGGLHGGDRHPGLLRPPEHRQTARCLLL